jgi:hypothetical protein
MILKSEERIANINNVPAILPESVGVVKRLRPASEGLCGSGSRGGRCPSLADYVTEMKPTRGAIAAGRVLESATF